MVDLLGGKYPGVARSYFFFPLLLHAKKKRDSGRTPNENRFAKLFGKNFIEFCRIEFVPGQFIVHPVDPIA